MEFGRIPVDGLAQVDFSLPADSELTRNVLSNAGKEASKPEILVGCAKWGRKEWVGLLYPPKTKEAEFLREYIRHFNSIEFNALFYKMPRPAQVAAWREIAQSVRNDFKFYPKFTQSITHFRRLKDAGDKTTEFLAAISEFGTTLGSSFLQLRDDFGPANFETLKTYLEDLPQDFQVFIEVRHKAWFSDPGARSDLFQMLHDLNKGVVITDAAGRRECVHMELTVPEAFIRFVGNGLHPTDFQRIDDWAERLARWCDSGLKKIHFFLHQHDEKDTPVLADYTLEKFNRVLGTGLQRLPLATK